MTWLMQERQAALPVIILGVISLVILGFGWSKSGRKEVLYGVAGVVVLLGVILALQRFVTTEAERVEATLLKIASDVGRNDLKALVEHIHSHAPQIRERVESEFPNYQFKEVKVTKIYEIKVELDRIPPRAIAKFMVMASGLDGFLEGDGTIYRYVILTFHQENGRWKVQDFDHQDIQRSIMK